MGDAPTDRMTARDATLLRQRWKRTQRLSYDETDRALANLERALQNLERGHRMLGEIAAGPWKDLKNGVAELADWSRDEHGRLPGEGSRPVRTTGRAGNGQRPPQARRGGSAR